MKHHYQGTQQCQLRAQHFLSPPRSRHMVLLEAGCAQPASPVAAFCFPDFLFLVRFMNLTSRQLGTGSDPASLPLGRRSPRLVTRWPVACDVHMLLLGSAVTCSAWPCLAGMQTAPSQQ